MVDISDGAALGPIYVERGGFPKPSSYHNAYTDGFATIFSTTDSAYRATRAKVVAPLFSTAAIRRDSRTLYESVERFLQALQKSKEMAKGRPVDLQMHTRALGLDVLASYLFRHRPSSSQEQIDQGSMIPWLNVIVDVGQFFYLPSQLFRFCVTLYIRFRPRRYTEAISTKFVHEYTMSLPRDDGNKDGTFQGRLLEQGISRENVAAECKSMMFAGIHSSGSVLAMTLWYLAKDPIMHDRLRAEILESRVGEADIQQLPYLQGVIKEGLRLAPANVTRLPRVVPGTGWHFGDHYLPPGTVVGIAGPQLFSNPDVFEAPTAFRPQRWFKPSAKMQRNLVPFSLGNRQCLAKNLATAELFMAVE